jgi:hypothetical protein
MQPSTMVARAGSARRPPALLSSRAGGLLLPRRPAARGLPPARAAPDAPATTTPSTTTNNKDRLPDSELTALIASLKRSARQPGAAGSLPGPAVVDAMVALEKQRLPADCWRKKAAQPNARWRLVFTAPEKVATASAKRQPHGPATVFPLAACQKFDDQAGVFTNGVFLGGGLASLTFAGAFDVSGRLLQFDVVRMAGNLGPWSFSFPVKKDAQGKTLAQYEAGERKKLPFFSYIFADDEMIVARGRSGGLAVWLRADAGWCASNGVTRVYG